MCIATIAWEAHPRWRLIVLANRDEYHDRPAAPLHRWAGTAILAGQDMRSGGTWLGVTDAPDGMGAKARTEARFVLVTNYRAPGFPEPTRPSRGGLVAELLAGAEPMAVPIGLYNPFNLFVADGAAGTFHLLSNHPTETRRLLAPGIHGLSNGGFEQPWPKTRQLSQALADWLASEANSLSLTGADHFTPLLPVLGTETPLASPPATPADVWSPLSPDPEPRLSPIFIRDPVYGTRCSTLVAIDREGAGLIVERRFDPTGRDTGETALTFSWPPSPALS